MFSHLCNMIYVIHIASMKQYICYRNAYIKRLYEVTASANNLKKQPQ